MLTSVYRAKNFLIKDDFSTVGDFFHRSGSCIYKSTLYNWATLLDINRKKDRRQTGGKLIEHY